MPAESSKQNELLALQTRLNQVNRQQQVGMLSFDEQGREYAKITNALIALIDAIEKSDFEVQGNAKSDRKRKRGSILYRIPNLMQLNKETKCLVRLAFLEEIIKENIELTEDKHIKSIRISEVMSVELLDRSQRGAFSITTHNQAEQFLDKDDYSEWIFYVKPLLEGLFPLVLKVSVLEEVRGKERVREIVLEESIQIVTGGPAQDAAFQTADYQFAKTNSERSVTEVESSDEDFQMVVKKAETKRTAPSSSYVPPINNRSLNPIRHYFPLLALFIVAAVSIWAVENQPEKNNNTLIEEPKTNTGSNNDIPIPEMIFVKGGIYTMGCKKGRDKNCDEDEKPAHEVQLQDFYIGKYEVTNQQYAFFLNSYGSDKVKSGAYEGQIMLETHKWGVQKVGTQWQAAESYKSHPVVYISWYGAVEYTKWLSAQTGKNFRLPSEAEWEYAARGGSKKQDFAYSGSDHIEEVAWYGGNSGSKTHRVGTKKANGLGLYDMSGNVYEWCMDCWNASYKGAPTNNAAWMKGDCTYRVLRGGSWNYGTRSCQSSDRYDNNPNLRYFNFGFRLARAY